MDNTEKEKLSDEYYEWVDETCEKDCAKSVIVFLENKGLIKGDECVG